MAKLTRGIGRGIVDGLTCMFSRPDHSGLVRMFETEYRKEYNFARKAGVNINDEFVKSFLATKSH